VSTKGRQAGRKMGEEEEEKKGNEKEGLHFAFL